MLHETVILDFSQFAACNVSAVIGLCAATDVYLYCPAEDWIEESSIDFECYVLKSSYPSKCDAPIPDVVRFRLDPTSRDGYTPICSLSNITTSCFASSSQCSCQTGNATHYKFQFTFTAASNYSGFWDCSVPCFNGLRPALLYSNDHCENRRVTGKDGSPLFLFSVSLLFDARYGPMAHCCRCKFYVSGFY